MSSKREEFQAFYERYIHLIYRYIHSKVGNREEAEDLTSQVFIKALKDVDYSRDQRSLQKWLFQVARTTIADHWRAYYRVSMSSLETLLEAGWEGPIEETEHNVVNLAPGERVRTLLQALPEKQREVLVCRFILNLPIKETASKMNLTETNVKVLQFRALKQAAKLEQTLPAAHSKATDQEIGEQV